GLLAIVAGLRLDAIEPRLRRESARGEGTAGEQPSPAEAHEERVEGADLLEKLLRGRALAGDDMRMVIGRDQRHAALLRELRADGLAVLAVAVVEDDLPAVALRGGHLRGRRVLGHH